MAGDLLGISVTGLNLSQTALRTAGHNIANANTDGYTRQTVTAEANPELFLGSGFVGNGVSVQSIERETSRFVVAQLRDDTSLFNEQQILLDNASQLDNLLSNPALGLSDAMQRFYASLQTGADNPTSIAARQLIISEGQSLVDRFNTLDNRLSEINDSLNQKIEGGVNDANALLDSIVALNNAIGRTSGAGSIPNDLFDKRDQALLKLSELVGLRVNEQSDGQVNVALISGESLILGGTVNHFDVVNSPEIPGNKDIALITNTGTKVISDRVSGGKLGGLLGFRGGMLDKSFNEIGRIAVSIAATFNTIHKQGLDLNGEFGGNMFADVNTDEAVRLRVLHSPENKPPYNRDMTLEITDPSKLTGSDYRVEIEEGSQRFSIVRVSDGKEVVSNLLTGRTPQNVEFDGLKMTFNGGVFQSGDKFYLQPTKGMSSALTFDLIDPEELAFAKPLLAQSDLGNLGNGQISFGEIMALESVTGQALPVFAMPGQMDPPMVIKFTSPSRFDVLDNSDPNNPVQLDPPIRNQLFIPGQINDIFPADAGEMMLTANGPSLGINSAVPSATLGNNGYPAERFIISQLSSDGTGSPETFSVITSAGSTAKEVADQMNKVPGISVNAWTEVRLQEIANFDVAATPPAAIYLNGSTTSLIETEFNSDGDPVVAEHVPADATSVEFMNYLADRINTLYGGEGITASSLTENGVTQLKIVDAFGNDVKLSVSNIELKVGDGVTIESNLPVLKELSGTDLNITVGGRFDVTLAANMKIETIPKESNFFGEIKQIDYDDKDIAKAYEASSYKLAYRGIQASIKGTPQSGDGFTISYNNNAASDNRNIMSLVDLEFNATLNNGKATLSDVYGLLVEDVGIRTGAAKINASASEGILEQSQTMRNAISGVNLDEEAANLIKFEQMYSANAQVISVARDIFDRLINSM